MKLWQGRTAWAVGAAAMALAGCGSPAVNNTAPANVAANAASPPLATAPAAPAAPLPIAPPAQTSAPDMSAAGPAPGPSPGGMAQAPANGPTSYCGIIRNTTANVQDVVAIDLDPGGGFSGRMLLGPSLQGGGRFSGTVADGVCSATTQGGVTFYGRCPANGQFSASYTIQGQEGMMRLSTSACPVN